MEEDKENVKPEKQETENQNTGFLNDSGKDLKQKLTNAAISKNEKAQKAKEFVENTRRNIDTLKNAINVVKDIIVNITTFIASPAGWAVIGVALILWIGYGVAPVLGTPNFSLTCNVVGDDGKWTKEICKAQGDGANSGRVEQASGSDSGYEAGNADAANGDLGKFTQKQLDEINKRGSTSYDWGQCTWGVQQLAPWVGPYWGHGKMWPASARAAGFKTGSKPKVGAIISWTEGTYGHVAYVIAVKSDTEIQVLESNYAVPGGTGGPIKNHRGWFNPQVTGSIEYIYEK